VRAPLTSYQRRLIVLLAAATFFEGFDFFALAQILPQLRADFRLDEQSGGALVAFANCGAVLSYALVQLAGRIGRRRALTLTILGYTVSSVLSGLAPNVWVFAAAQLAARFFLLGEWAIAMIYAAEEFPADRRATVMGTIQAFSSLGGILCAGVVPLLLRTPIGWRSVFFVGAVPLVLVAIARRNLRETARFEALEVARSAPGAAKLAVTLTRIWRTPYRNRMLLLAALWLLTYIGTQSAITFWKEFALAERGLTDAQVGTCLTIAAVGSLPLIFTVGKLLDRFGRRVGAVIIFVLGGAGIALAYTLHGQWPLTAALVFALFGVTAVLPVLNSYTTELFPTELRSDAYVWSNNLLGRFGYVLSPLLVGMLAQRTSWSLAVSSTAGALGLALALILWRFPETRGRELEETSALH
jgi:putative MFS transporter